MHFKKCKWKQIAHVNYRPFCRNCIRFILSVLFSINYIPMKLHYIQQYQYPGNFISKDRQLKPNQGQWNTKQRESHWLKHLKAREWETREGKGKDSDYISPVNDTQQEHYCACVCQCVCLFVSACLQNCLCAVGACMHICLHVFCVCAPACVMPEDIRAVIEWW